MKYLSLLIILFSINSFANVVDCTEDKVDLNPGDVISADMVKDIFDRISGVTSGMNPDELDGTWICTSYNTVFFDNSGYSQNPDGLGASMTQDVKFLKQSDNTFVITYQNNLANHLFIAGSDSTCRGKLISGSYMYTGPTASNSCLNAGLWPVKRISKSCFVWQVTSVTPLSQLTTCKKKSDVPLAPTNLVATLSGSSVSLSWTSGDSSAISFTLKAKTSATGTYSDVVTNNSGTTYTDTLSSGTKWYRVYGVNASGESIGSNVVSVTR